MYDEEIKGEEAWEGRQEHSEGNRSRMVVRILMSRLLAQHNLYYVHQNRTEVRRAERMRQEKMRPRLTALS